MCAWSTTWALVISRKYYSKTHPIHTRARTRTRMHSNAHTHHHRQILVLQGLQQHLLSCECVCVCVCEPPNTLPHYCPSHATPHSPPQLPAAVRPKTDHRRYAPHPAAGTRPTRAEVGAMTTFLRCDAQSSNCRSTWKPVRATKSVTNTEKCAAHNTSRRAIPCRGPGFLGPVRRGKSRLVEKLRLPFMTRCLG